MNRINFIYKEFHLINKDFSNSKGQAINAIHEILTKDNKFIFFAEILHIISLQWTSIRILSTDKTTLSTSHLIDLDQLPLRNQIDSLKTSMDIDIKYEKAMLIRNCHGDYAISKGKWLNISETESCLSVQIYFCDSKTCHNFSVKISNDFEIRTKYIDAIVNLKSGDVFFKFNRKIELTTECVEISSIMAIIFSICVIYTLLEPKETSKPINHDHEEIFLDSIGLNDLMQNACFKSSQKGPSWVFNEIDVNSKIYF